MIQALLSALHLLGLGVGLGSLFARGRALKRQDIDAVLYADNWWGLAAILWWTTGPIRAFSTLEKGSAFYLHQPMFLWKMGLFAVAGLVEMWPMITFIRWRIAKSRGLPIDTTRIGWFYRINCFELTIIAILPFLAAMMARGQGW